MGASLAERCRLFELPFCLAKTWPYEGKSDVEIGAGGWDFERINRRYAWHLRILDEQPGGALRNDAAAKALLRWAAVERAAWLEVVPNGPRLMFPS